LKNEVEVYAVQFAESKCMLQPVQVFLITFKVEKMGCKHSDFIGFNL